MQIYNKMLVAFRCLFLHNPSCCQAAAQFASMQAEVGESSEQSVPDPVLILTWAVAIKFGVRFPSKPGSLQTRKWRWAQRGLPDGPLQLTTTADCHARFLPMGSCLRPCNWTLQRPGPWVNKHPFLVSICGWLQAHLRLDDLCSTPGGPPPAAVGPPQALFGPPPGH